MTSCRCLLMVGGIHGPVSYTECGGSPLCDGHAPCSRYITLRAVHVIGLTVEHRGTPHMGEPLEPHTPTVPVPSLPPCTSMLPERGCTLC